MTVLIIIACILLFIVSLFFVQLKFVIRYDDGLYASLHVLGLRFRLYPEKPPKQKMSVKKLRKLRKKLLKKKENEGLEKAIGKKSKKKKKKFSDIAALVKEIAYLVTKISERLFKYLRFNIKKLDIVVATDDPAKTALTFGVVCSTLNQLIDRIESSDCRYKFGDMECRCDYLSNKFSCKADIVLKIRVWQALNVLLYSLTQYFKSDLNKGGIINGQQDK